MIGGTPAAPAVTRSTRAVPAVIGGAPAAPGALRSLAAVQGILPDGTATGCSGSVVAARLVLTAAHCVLDPTTGARLPADRLLVTAGREDVADAPGSATSAVRRIVVEPGFDPTTLDHDAALLILASPTSAPPLRLGPVSAGAPAQLAGWGLTAGTASAGPARVHVAPTVVQDPATCASAWGVDFDATTELCVLDTPTLSAGPCHGDSGGPLLAGGVEVGVAGYVAPGCVTGVPAVYQRADVITPWVGGVRAALRRGSSAVGRRSRGR